MKSITHLPLAMLAFWLLFFGALDADDVDFAKQIAPILSNKCVECHNASLQMADLRLDSRQAMIDAGVLVPKDAKNSSLIFRLHDRDQGILMPPTGRLAQSQIDVLKKWVDAGAAWPASVKLASDATPVNSESTRAKAIFAVIRNNELDALREMLRDKSLVSSRDQHAATPLMHAALYASAAAVKELLEHQANPNDVDNDGLTPLMYASFGDADMVRLLLKGGANVDTQSKLGRTALLMASAYAGNTPVVKQLLSAGANVKYADRRGWTAVVLAARTGDTELVQTLLDAGGDVNGGNAMRLAPGTPLMQAAWAGDVATVKLLLTRQANKNQRSLDASLISAATHGYLTLVDLLLAAGANPEAKIVTNYIPETPLLAAAYSDSMNAAVVEKLLARKVSLQHQDNRGETASSIALQKGNSKIAKLLGKQPASSKVTANPTNSKNARFGQAEIKQVAQKSLSRLQSSGPIFFAKSGCTACHQQSATSLLVKMARPRGLKVDEKTERQQIKLTAADLGRKRLTFLQRMKSGGTAHRIAYLLWGLKAGGYPQDEITDVMCLELLGLQLHDGRWVSDAHRPPTEYASISATAVAMQAIQHFCPPGWKKKADARIRKATQWLTQAKPNANAEKAFRLLGLYWGKADNAVIRKASQSLLEDQAPNGGWSQLDSLETDAYATGLSLFALAQSQCLSPSDAQYQRGIDFLMRTVQKDGTWHVKSRSFKFQPYFESGFPHGHDQWISAAATGWAAMALLHAVDIPRNAATQKTQPFVSYPDKITPYLERIHRKSAGVSKGKLSFRPDYPGGFEKWQHDARNQLTELLGLDRMQNELTDHQPKVQLQDPIDEGDYLRQQGSIEAEPGVQIPFWLLTPKTIPTNRPLVICAHGHDTNGWNSYAGVYTDEAHRKKIEAKDGNIGVLAVKRGFVALVPATRGLAAVTSVPDLKGRHGKRDCRAQLMHCLIAGRTPVGERVWDTQRILDWALKNVDHIDSQKVVMLGNSGGGVLTVYAAALDERIRVAIPSCSFSSYTSSTGFLFHCDCCLVPRAEVELADMSDIGALVAPRALLAVHGVKDGLHWKPDVETAMNRVREIYAAANSSGQFQHEWGSAGHQFYPKRMWPFVHKHLDDAN